MIWLAAAILAGVALMPLLWSLRRSITLRGRREAALAFHRAQLAELERDLAEGRIAAEDHAGAVLEVQRRVLAASTDQEPLPPGSPRSPLLITLILVPLAAFALYAIGGSPDLPSEPLAQRIAAAQVREQRENALIALLRHKLSTLDPHTVLARQGYVLLGNAEARMGRMQQAADAWQTALADRFDPTLAAETGEAMTEAAGHVTRQAAALFRHALKDAPADAPWRPMAVKRLGGAN
ncbi:MAG TPA: c-type cytochrome biogenesis protein CcmI [Acetobacteraceae bacterium]|nr:c-type cytochrome biogenesis protein CcmI [Acetobacteraceae bacterium]